MVDRAAVGRRSKRKGKLGELELAKELTAYGYECRRGYQTDGRFVADVVGLPGIRIECKRAEKQNMLDWLKQVEADANEGEIPAVFHRRNREPWMVTQTLDNWMVLYQEAKHDER